MKQLLSVKRSLEFVFGTVACVIVTLLLGFILYNLS